MMKQKHLLGLEHFPADDLAKIIETSFSFKEILDRPIKKVPSLQGSYFRQRSPDHVCDEIEWLRDKYGIKEIVFDDDNMLTNTRRAKNLFKRIIERGLKMPWWYSSVAVWRLDEEMIDLMIESGLQNMNIAIESGSERITRNIVLKPLDYKHAKKMVPMRTSVRASLL